MYKRLRLRQNKSIIALTVFLVLIASMGIGKAGWTDGLDVVFYIGAFAVIIGILLARSLLPGLIAHTFSLIIGSAWSFWVVSRLLPNEFSWPMRWENMVERLANWSRIAVEGGVNYDNLMFVFQMGLIVWGASYLTAWFIFRAGKVWSAIIPGGIILLINLYYAPNNLTIWFIIFLLVSMILLVRFNLHQQEERWRANQVYFRSDIGFDFLRDGLIFSVLIITLAWVAPAIDESQTIKVFGVVDREWRVAQQQWNRMFASLNYRPDPLLGVNTFGQSLSLGGPRKLTVEPVMIVNAPGGRYWRAAVYDEYNGFGWTSNDREEINFKANAPVSSLPFYRARQPFTQTFSIFREGATVLYAVANPISVNRGAQGKATIISKDQVGNDPQSYWLGRRGPWVEEITYLESDRRLEENEPYQVVSMVSVATKEELRADSDRYPDWVSERYLQLPEGIPQRVFDLADDITADADTPYDKAAAIEQYLRTNIAYNEGIQAPPAGRDKIDYILFDLKQAYCDYYASSMIVMLRSQGIPARLAAGYARGQVETLDNQEQVYFVQNKDAHSWVEVFFPKYGWIEFEPTAAQPVIIRQSSEDEADSDRPENDEFLNNFLDEEDAIDRVENIDDFGSEDLNTAPTFSVNLPFWGEVSVPLGAVKGLAVGGILLVLIVGGVNLYTRRREKDETELPTAGSIYLAMLKLSSWMGLKKRPGQTPYEHAAEINAAVPAVKPEVDLITTEYVQRRFSRAYTTPTEIKKQLLEAWNKLRPAFYKTTFQRRNPLRKFRLPFKW